MEQEKIKLYPLATIDLNLRYARRLEGNKIRHYRVSMLGILSGISAQDMILKYLKDKEGVEAIIVQQPSQQTSSSVSVLKIEDVTDKVLKGLAKVKKQLSLKTTSLLHEWVEYKSSWDRYRDLFDHYFYKYTYPVVCRLLFKPLPLWYGIAKTADVYVGKRRGFHRIDQVRFLIYGYEEPDEQLAFVKLRNDLKNLSDKGLILRSLCMPSTLELADTIGSGNKMKCVFCYVAVDTKKLYELTGKDPLSYPPVKLDDIGIHETDEGETNWLDMDPRYKYQIEEVEIPFCDVEANHAAVVKSYEDSVETVNEIAKKAKKNLSNVEKINSRTKTRNPNDASTYFDLDGQFSVDDYLRSKEAFTDKTTVYVDVDLKKKS